jgi:STE24 endopeptidase
MANLDLDPERQESARHYARIRRWLMLVELVLGTSYLLAWLFLGWSESLRDYNQSWTPSPWVGVLVYGLVFGGCYLLLELPLSFFQGFSLPHRFQQSNQTLKGWWMDFFKGTVLSGLLGLLFLEIIYFMLRLFPASWWLWAAGVLLAINMLLANLAPILIFPLFNKFQPLAEGYQHLQDRLLSLAERASMPVIGVFSFDMSRQTKSANAGITGLGYTRRIILGDTLLSEFSTEEIETVLAHEIGHYKNHDIPLGIMVQTFLTLGGLYLASRGLSWGITLFDYQDVADIAALPLLILSLGAYGLITMPLSNLFSRWRENLADDFALRLTGNGQAYAAALIRLSNQNLAEVDPQTWVEILLHSHPALRKRIQKAQTYQPVD